MGAGSRRPSSQRQWIWSDRIGINSLQESQGASQAQLRAGAAARCRVRPTQSALAAGQGLGLRRSRAWLATAMLAVLGMGRRPSLPISGGGPWRPRPDTRSLTPAPPAPPLPPPSQPRSGPGPRPGALPLEPPARPSSPRAPRALPLGPLLRLFHRPAPARVGADHGRRAAARARRPPDPQRQRGPRRSEALAVGAGA